MSYLDCPIKNYNQGEDRKKIRDNWPFPEKKINNISKNDRKKHDDEMFLDAHGPTAEKLVDGGDILINAIKGKFPPYPPEEKILKHRNMEKAIDGMGYSTTEEINLGGLPC